MAESFLIKKPQHTFDSLFSCILHVYCALRAFQQPGDLQPSGNVTHFFVNYLLFWPAPSWFLKPQVTTFGKGVGG